MGYIYVLRFGESNEYKVGRTVDLKKRQRAHQVGNPRKLTLFDSIEHDDYKEGEKYLKSLLADHRLEGGTETFGLSDEELTEALAATRVYLAEELPRRRRIEEFAGLVSAEEMLAPTEAAAEAFARLQEIRAKRARLRPEAERREAEQLELDSRYEAEQAALEERYRELTAAEFALDDEEEQLRMVVMDEIGAARGIEGIATWETVYGRGRFDEEWLKEDEPELYEKYSIKFDGAAFRRDHKKAYEAHMRKTTSRVFRWIDEPDLDDGDGPDNITDDY